jgi:hypothetical protein
MYEYEQDGAQIEKSWLLAFLLLGWMFERLNTFLLA